MPPCLAFAHGSGDWISILVLVRQVTHRTASVLGDLFAERQLSLHSRADAPSTVTCLPYSGPCGPPSAPRTVSLVGSSLRPANVSCGLLGFGSSFLLSFLLACYSNHGLSLPFCLTASSSYLALSSLEISVPWPHCIQLWKEVSAGTQCWTHPSPQQSTIV